MTENDVTGEYEIRGGAWEVLFVLFFYAGVVVTMMGTFGVVPAVFVPIGLPLALFSILAIASSPTYLLISGCSLVLERTRFYLGFSRPIPLSGVHGIRVTESRRSLDWQDGSQPDKDVSYFIHVDLLTDRGRVRAFRSPLNSTPGENRRRAMEIADRLSGMTHLPIEQKLK